MVSDMKYWTLSVEDHCQGALPQQYPHLSRIRWGASSCVRLEWAASGSCPGPMSVPASVPAVFAPISAAGDFERLRVANHVRSAQPVGDGRGPRPHARCPWAVGLAMWRLPHDACTARPGDLWKPVAPGIRGSFCAFVAVRRRAGGWVCRGPRCCACASCRPSIGQPS